MQPEITLPLHDVADLRDAAELVMAVETFVTNQLGGRQALRLRGRLLVDPQAAYAQVAPRFRSLGYTALLEEDPLGAALVALPGTIETKPSRLWVALLLFGLTIISTMSVGGLTAQGYDIGLGLAFSVSLLGILLSHELGHYLVARRLGVAVSFPFFIPLPFSPLGTMGAFIQMKEPPPDRRALLSIAIAGPLAGLIVAIPVLIIGLLLSPVQALPPPTPEQPLFMEGNSLVYAALKVLLFGRFLPSGGQDVMLHPVAFAGWAGLLVTGLNLLPAGQLDGGHLLYGLVGRRVARMASWVIAGVLVVLGFFWSGWWLWAVLIAVFGQQSAPVLNDLTPLDAPRRTLAVIGLIVFILVFTPLPFTQLTALP